MKSFEIDRVVLVDGVFRPRRQLVEKYLSEFDLDRLMHSFRVNAGIPSDAEPLGGWEALGCAVRGQFVGHYLAAAAKFAFCGNDFLRRRAEDIIEIMAECAREDGYLSAFPEEELDKLEENETFGIWAPYYALHKIINGLLSSYRLIGSSKALTLATGLALYIYKRFQKLGFWKTDNILRCSHINPANEFGGIGDSLYSLWEITGDSRILECAKIFDRDYFLMNLSRGRDILTDLHANTHLAMVTSSLHRYSVTGEEEYKTAAVNFYDFLTPRTFANGSSSSRAKHPITGGVSEKAEHWSSPLLTAEDITGGECESCCAHNTENILSLLLEINPVEALRYLNHLERLKYNAVLNSASGTTGLSQYHQPLGKDSKKKFSTPYNNFWCCTGSGIEALSALQKDIWFEDGDCIFINLFVSSALKYTSETEIIMTTDYPKSDSVSLSVKTEKPVKLTFSFKKGTVSNVRVRGALTPLSTSSYADSVGGVFGNGDTVTFDINAEIHIETLSGDDSIFAVYYGNILLALTEGDYKRGDKIERNGNGEFISAGAKFIPLYSVEDETYTVYFNSAESSGAKDGSDAYRYQ